MKRGFLTALNNGVNKNGFNELVDFRGLAFVLTMALSFAVNAVIEIAPLSSEELEGRYRELIEELRCPKCQNQNLADSNSPISADLREQVRVLLEEGKTDDEVVAYLVDRYGDFVRYRPAVKENTLLLWFGPILVAFLGLVIVLLFIRRQRGASVAKTGELSADEKVRLNQLLAKSEQDNAE